MHSLVLIKPDAIRRHLGSSILNRIECEQFNISGLRMLVAGYSRLERHYWEHRHQTWLLELLDSMNAGPLWAVKVEHREFPDETIDRMRTLIGPYKNRIYATIRCDYAINDRENSIHASDSLVAAKRECEIWFPGDNYGS